MFRADRRLHYKRPGGQEEYMKKECLIVMACVAALAASASAQQAKSSDPWTFECDPHYRAVVGPCIKNNEPSVLSLLFGTAQKVAPASVSVEAPKPPPVAVAVAVPQQPNTKAQVAQAQPPVRTPKKISPVVSEKPQTISQHQEATCGGMYEMWVTHPDGTRHCCDLLAANHHGC